MGYFLKLFLSCNLHRVSEITEYMEIQLSIEDRRQLMQLMLDEEIRQTVFQIPADKSPRPDGFIGSFYHKYWDVVGKDIVDMVKAFWFSGRLLRKLNRTHLVLIPKVPNPRRMTQLRPISLCNVVYKVIAKLMTN